MLSTLTDAARELGVNIGTLRNYAQRGCPGIHAKRGRPSATNQSSYDVEAIREWARAQPRLRPVEEAEGFKFCRGCKATKSVSEFWKHSSRRDGLSIYCSPCELERQAIRHSKPAYREYQGCWRENNREYLRQLDRDWRESHREEHAARTRDYRARHPDWMPRYLREYERRFPERAAAHKAVAQAVKSGRLYKPVTCEHCGGIPKHPLHGHHEDYSRPLDVIWLCPSCHGARHRVVSTC